MKAKYLFILTALVALPLVVAEPAHAQSAKDHISQLKANVAESNAILRHYKWIETTEVSKDGDVKSTKQQQCYYGDDGSIQKITLDQSSSSGRTPIGPFRRAIKQDMKQEMADYVKSAAELAKSYVPPSSSKIQACKDSGNFSLKMLGDSRALFVFQSYQLPGDTYSIEVNMATNRPVALKVNTYLNDPSQVVTMKVTMGQLNSGATFASKIVLNAEAKGITVTTKNSGYERRN